jgi:DNA-binding MarR family transcriptional regulator
MYAFIRCAYSVADFIEARLAAVGLSLPKLAALQRLVDAGDSLPLGQLAGRLSCVKSNVTQLVDRLEADGFVSRMPDPADKRSRLAVITDAGKRAWEEGSRIQREAEDRLFASLTDDDAIKLAEILAKLKPRCGCPDL